MGTRRHRRWPKILGVTLLALGGLLVAAGVTAALLADRIAASYLDRRLSQLSAQLDRPVSAKSVDVHPLTGAITLTDLTIGPAKTAPEGTPPALVVEQASLDLGVMRTLGTAGRRPYLQALQIEGMRVGVVKHDDGRLNWQHIAEALTPEEPPPEPNRLRKTKVEQLEVRDGILLLHPSPTSEPQARISHINIQLADASLAEGGHLDLSAAVLQNEPNLRITGTLPPTPEEGGFVIPTLTAELQPTPLAPLAPFLSSLGAGAEMLSEGTLRANVRVKDTTEGEPEQLQMAAQMELTRGRFSNGEPFDGRVMLEGSAAPEQGWLLIDQARLQAGEMQLAASGEVHNLFTGEDDAEVPRVKDLRVRSQGLSFERIRNLYPGLDALTDPLELGGPFSIRAEGGGTEAEQEIELQVVLDEARVTWPGEATKPPGTPLRLASTLVTTRESVRVPRAYLRLASWELAAEGQVNLRGEEPPHFAFKVHTTRPQAAGLLQLLAKAPQGARATGGELAVQGAVEGTAQSLNASARMRLTDLNLRAAPTSLVGSGSAQLEVTTQGDAGRGSITADLSPLRVTHPRLIRKPQGTPFTFNAQWQRTGTSTELTYDVNLASLDAEGELIVQSVQEGRRFEAHAALPTFALGPVLDLLPRVDRASLGDIHLGGDVRAQGVLGKPATTQITLPRFEASAGESAVRGSATLRNLNRPTVQLEAQARYLDVNDFLPDTHGERDEASRKGRKGDEAARKGDARWAKLNGQITAQVDKGRAGNVPYQNLVAELRVQDGLATAEVLEVDVFGGHMSGAGSAFPVAPQAGAYRLKGEVAQAELPGVLKHLGQAEQLLVGTLGASFDLSSAGLTPAAITRTLSGSITGSVQQAEYLPANAFLALTDQLASITTVPALAESLQRVGGQSDRQSWQLGNIEGEIRFDKGAAIIAQPLTAHPPQGELRLDGRVSLGGAADLEATLALRPEVFEELLGMDPKAPRVDLGDAPIPVTFRVQGPLKDPRFSFGSLEELLTPLAKAYLQGAAQERIQRGVGEVFEKLGEDVLPRRP